MCLHLSKRKTREKIFYKEEKKHASHCKLNSKWIHVLTRYSRETERGDNATSMFVNQKGGDNALVCL